MSGYYIIPIPSHYLDLSGGTVTGQTFFASGLSANTFYLTNTPTNDNSLNSVLVYNPITKAIEYRDATSIGVLGSFVPLSGGSMTGPLSVPSLSASSITGYTFYSGSTPLENIFVSDGINIGSGQTSVFKQKNNNSLEFRTISAGTSVIINQVSDTIVISVTGTTGSSGASGTSGSAGTSGSHGTSGTSGSAGATGTSGSSGSAGTSGSAGSSGTSGSSGTVGSSGTSGSAGSSGTSGSSGTVGSSGTSGSAGSSGTSGSSGTVGSSGTSGSAGTSGSSGSSGINGSSGSSGTSSSAGTSGSSGTSSTLSIENGLNTYTGYTITSGVTVNVSGLTIDNLTVTGSSNTWNLSAYTFSANTIFSGNTSIENIFPSNAINIGSGSGSTGVFAQKNNNLLEFKSLSAGTKISITGSSDTLTIQTSGVNSYYTQATAPSGTTSNPLYDGDRWFNTTIGVEFVYIDDGNSSQWVEPLLSITGGTSGGTISGSGTLNYLTKFTSSTSIGNTVTPVVENNTGIVVGGTSVDSSAIFQIDSTTLGFLPPRMTQTQLNNIASPAVGLIVYQTNGVEGLYIFKSDNNWHLLG